MEWTCTQSKGLRWGEFELHSRETKGSRVQPFANAVRDGLGISLIIACLVLRQAFEHCVEVAVDAVICDLSFRPRRAPLLTQIVRLGRTTTKCSGISFRFLRAVSTKSRGNESRATLHRHHAPEGRMPP